MEFTITTLLGSYNQPKFQGDVQFFKGVCYMNIDPASGVSALLLLLSLSPIVT